MAMDTSNEHAAFYWFDWQQISDSGHPNYGSYVYRNLLPAFAPARQCSVTGSSIPTAFCYFDDGDFLPQAPLQLYCADPEESRVLEQVRTKGPEAFYVVGVYSLGNDMNLQDVGRALKTSGVVGYVGMTSGAPGLDIEAYLALTRGMSLCHAFDLKFGDRIVKASFSFMSDEELMALGFQLMEK